MAKKTRKQKQRAPMRRAAPPVTRAAATPAATPEVDPGGEPEPLVGAATISAADSIAIDLGAADPGRRRVERVAPAAARTARAKPGRTQSSGYIQPLESEDAAIPFDRVPYVPADLRRVAIIATLMIALIIIADIIVSNVVK
jgi:hypothetical protein